MMRSFCPFWVQWLVANGIGGAIVGALESSGFQFLATLILTGPIVGVAQALVLQRYRLSRHWVLASSIGWLVGVYATIGLSQVVQPLVVFLTEWFGWEVFWLNMVNQPLILGVFGLAQWCVLRRYAERAGWWVVISAIGGAVQGGISTSVCAVGCGAMMGEVGAGVTTAIVYGLGWMGYGGVTGRMMEMQMNVSGRR